MISVIVVTYNRKEWLRECLDSILAQEFSGSFEVVVVDNGSSDGTEALVSGAFKGRVRYLKTGGILSLEECKDRGVLAAAGQELVFTDDDCLVSPDWLTAAHRSLESCDVVGGVVLALGAPNYPWWWRRSLEWIIGINAAPDKTYPPLGSNVAFRRSAFPVFLSEKAVAGGCPYGEDNARLARATALGAHWRIDRRMVVYHRVPDDRLRFRYAVLRSFREGLALSARSSGGRTSFVEAARFLTRPVLLLISWDLNHFFRMIAWAGYVTGRATMFLSGKE